jgi:hypothetical protein
MPGLYNPIFGYSYILLLVGDRIVQQNKRFVWKKIFKLVQECLERLIIICSLPHVRISSLPK